MNIISILFITAIIPLFGYMLYISDMRQGRDSRGKFIRKAKQEKEEEIEPYHSNVLRGGVVV